MDKSQQAYSEWYRECAGQPNELRVIWDAAWQASRKQALEEAVKACLDIEEPPSRNYGNAPTFNDGKYDAADAIRSLEGNAKETT